MRLHRLVGILLSVLLLLAGCEEVKETISEEELLAALKALVEDDEAFSTDGLGDAGLYDDEYEQSLSLGKSPADTLWPGRFLGIRWGRRITERSWDLSIDELGKDAAYATITGTISGTLLVGGRVVIASGDTAIVDTLAKPFNLTTTRRVRFARVSDTGDPLKDWRIDGLTALLGTAGSKVSLEALAFSLSDTGAVYFSLLRGEVLSRFFDRQSLPTFKPLLPVAVFVTVDNVGPEFPIGSGEKVVLRRLGMYPGVGGFMIRRSLNDLGWGIDVKARDDVYSGVWISRRKPEHPRAFRLFVEVTDLASLFVEEELFHTEFIGLPYLVSDEDQQNPL